MSCCSPDFKMPDENQILLPKVPRQHNNVHFDMKDKPAPNLGQENTQPADRDDSDMLELTIFNKPQKGIFDEASYDDEGLVYDFNNLLTEVPVSPIPTLRIHNIHPQS
ncbi:hypothetical protein Tco_0204042 [Tanacetum coccineum]